MCIIFGKNLKELRNEKNLSQAKFAKIIDTNQTSIWKWETGQTEPDINTIRKIAIFFGETTDYILGMDEIKRSVLKTDLFKQ